MVRIKIDDIEISDICRPYIIAEISANHNGQLEKALDMIKIAKKCGCSAVKIQTYTPDTITLNSNSEDFTIQDGLWKGKTLYELYDEAHTPWEWHKELFEEAKRNHITLFSSPFDFTAIDFLEDLNAPAYKIASFEAIDLPLIKYAASTGKPLIISTGLADLEEIKEAYETAKEGGCIHPILLHCVSGYPAPLEDYNLNTILDMKKNFNTVIGISDHTLQNTTALASIALGGRVIEKHFTMDRSGGGPDDSFSLEPDELSNLVEGAYATYKALGKADYGLKSSEASNIKFRRSLYFVKDLKRGDLITSSDIRSVRPGYGEHPKNLELFINKKVVEDIKKNTPANLSLIESDL
jgi:N-acetylneuraminate synthase